MVVKSWILYLHLQFSWQVFFRLIDNFLSKNYFPSCKIVNNARCVSVVESIKITQKINISCLKYNATIWICIIQTHSSTLYSGRESPCNPIRGYQMSIEQTDRKVMMKTVEERLTVWLLSIRAIINRCLLK